MRDATGMGECEFCSEHVKQLPGLVLAQMPHPREVTAYTLELLPTVLKCAVKYITVKTQIG